MVGRATQSRVLEWMGGGYPELYVRFVGPTRVICKGYWQAQKVQAQL